MNGESAHYRRARRRHRPRNHGRRRSHILKAAGARLDIEDDRDRREGLPARATPRASSPEPWESLRRTKVFLKAPITTPQGGGFKSLNVTMRKTLGLYANVRPCVSYHPFVETKHPVMDVVIVRENEEDLYAGIEYQPDRRGRPVPEADHAGPAREKIVRYAFEYARRNNRKKVTCFTKDNIMKMTDGLFHKVFDEIGAEYPDIENEHWIVDIGAAKLADTPEAFDVIVMPNLYGDILSDVAAQIAGSVGLAGSANIGEHVRDVRGDPRLGAAARRPEPGEPVGPAARRRDDARPHRPARRRRARPQRLAARRSRTASTPTTSTTKGQQAEGRHQGVRASRRRRGSASRREAEAGEATPPPDRARGRPPAHGPSGDPQEGHGGRRRVHLLGTWKGEQILERELEALAGRPSSSTMVTNRGVKVWPGGFERRSAATAGAAASMRLRA